MKVRNLQVPLPANKYFSKIEVNDDGIHAEVKEKKRIALLFICVNFNYWPYLRNVIEDAKKNFLPHHNVDFFAWTDIPLEDREEVTTRIQQLPTNEQIQGFRDFAKTLDDLNQIAKLVSQETIKDTISFVRDRKDLTITPTEPIEWPMGTLMRYHLFLQKEEELKDYDYVYYLDVDMRVVDKVSDEVLTEGLTAAEHPMYALHPSFIPPYEPNENSTAFIPRLGRVVDEEGRKRFKPLYLAGGFQGGTGKEFIRAMKVMRKNIDTDFNQNYTAIWNDESHWNRYLFTYKGPLTVLSPSYIYPDSLIKEYYEPRWGRPYQPKIITLTKPWNLTKEGAAAIRDHIGDKTQYQQALLANKYKCETCGDIISQPKMHIEKIVTCTGPGQPHQIQMRPATV